MNYSVSDSHEVDFRYLVVISIIIELKTFFKLLTIILYNLDTIPKQLKPKLISKYW